MDLFMTLEMGHGSSRKSSMHVAGSLEELPGGIFYGLRLYRLHAGQIFIMTIFKAFLFFFSFL
jgi:hypothetical protein